MKTLKLPRYNYGPIVLKILSEFRRHHNLPEDLIPPPQTGQTTPEALASIVDHLLWSMGMSKRDEIIKEVEEYIDGLHRNCR